MISPAILERRRAPDLENSQKRAKESVDPVPGKASGKAARAAAEHPKKKAVLTVSAVFPAVSPPTLYLGSSAFCAFPAVFQVGHTAPL